MSGQRTPQREEDRRDSGFAGVVLLTAALADVVDELRRLNVLLEQVVEERRGAARWPGWLRR